MHIAPLLNSTNNTIFTAKTPKIDIDLAKKYMAENRTQEELANFYGVSISVVSRQLKHMGVKWKRAGKIPLNELRKLVDRGDKIVDIANLYNCSPSRVSNLIIANGLTKSNQRSIFENYFKKILANEITQKEVAKILNKTPETIRRWVKDLVGTGKKVYNQITVLELLKKGYTNDEIVELLGVAKVTVKNVRYKYKSELKGFETSKQAEKIRYRAIVNENSEKILDSIKNRDSIQVIAKELGVPKSFVEDFLMSPDIKPLYRKLYFQFV